MNRTREQLKAAKARKEWLRIQESKEEKNQTPNLKTVKPVEEKNALSAVLKAS